MSRKMLLPALLTTALVAAPGMVNASQAKPCQGGFFLSAGVGMVNHNLKRTQSADQVKANAKAAFEALRDDALAQIAKAEFKAVPDFATQPTQAAALVAQLRPIADSADAIVSGITVDKSSTDPINLEEAFVKEGVLYIVKNDDTGLIGANINKILGLYPIKSVVIYAGSQASADQMKAFFTNANKPKFEDVAANLSKLGFFVANRDIAMYQGSNGEISTYTSPKGVAFQLMGGYRHTLGNNMAAAFAAYFGFGLGNGRNAKVGETEVLKAKERFHYGLELHLGAYVTPTTFLFAKGVMESTSFKFPNYNKVGTQTKDDTKDGHAHTTHFRPGMGVGMTTNIQKNLGVGIDYTYLFSGGKDLKTGGRDAAGTELKVGRVKGDTHRVMLRLIWTI